MLRWFLMMALRNKEKERGMEIGESYLSAKVCDNLFFFSVQNHKKTEHTHKTWQNKKYQSNSSTSNIPVLPPQDKTQQHHNTNRMGLNSFGEASLDSLIL